MRETTHNKRASRNNPFQFCFEKTRKIFPMEKFEQNTNKVKGKKFERTRCTVDNGPETA